MTMDKVVGMVDPSHLPAFLGGASAVAVGAATVVANSMPSGDTWAVWGVPGIVIVGVFNAVVKVLRWADTRHERNEAADRAQWEAQLDLLRSRAEAAEAERAGF